jgi:hypothetical protein
VCGNCFVLFSSETYDYNKDNTKILEVLFFFPNYAMFQLCNNKVLEFIQLWGPHPFIPLTYMAINKKNIFLSEQKDKDLLIMQPIEQN